ncbi:DUF1707 domain-containing protein [Brevibacterium sp. 50QC2O2]|uniref:DUF1707 SHOCT-like domain-containing protein n=1 Tax=Brevibacterium sp. 50QC2O2 TaxID=2968459 RepID=UPI00211C0F0C|nr:DUF1707 domain-containing protein [Brevibacterium sp. 50QC2O2]MCQ9387079.1 DUF1707 domain-containing protein [Brevibacterium sp. 50QC2O2]
MRPSHAERAPYIAALQESLVDGRLTQGLYEERLAAAESAQSFDALDKLFTDLPYDPRALRPAPAGGTADGAAADTAASRRKAKKEAAKRRRREASRGARRDTAAQAPSGTHVRKLLGRLVVLVVTVAIGAGGYTGVHMIASAAANQDSATGRDMSTEAGRQQPAPDDLPAVGQDFANVPALTPDTVARVLDYVADKGPKGTVTSLQAYDDYTTVDVQGKGKGSTYLVFRAGEAPRSQARKDVRFEPLHDQEALKRIDLQQIMARARADLGQDGEMRSIDISYSNLDKDYRKMGDRIEVEFEPSGSGEPSTIAYDLKGKKLYTDD